jgi:hypothetical protein
MTVLQATGTKPIAGRRRVKGRKEVGMLGLSVARTVDRVAVDNVRGQRWGLRQKLTALTKDA